MIRLSSTDICAVTDVTFRQLDHWATHGLPPSIAHARGSGTQRIWSLDDAIILQLMSAWSRATAGRSVLGIVLGHVPVLREALRTGIPFVTIRLSDSLLAITYRVDDARALVERRLSESGIDKRVSA